MKRLFLFFTCVTVLGFLLNAPPATAQGKLEGVWRIAEVNISGPNPIKLALDVSHPGFFIVTRKHWCLINVQNANRPDLAQQDATDAQKVAMWGPFEAMAGTYEMKGDTATLFISVSKNPSNMARGAFYASEFKFEGDTVIWTPKSDQNGTIANPIVTKLVRVE